MSAAYAQSKAVVQRWQVPIHREGIRADLYLVEHVGRLTRAKAQHIITSGDFRFSPLPLSGRGIKGEGAPQLKPSKVLYGGESVELWRLPPDEERPPEHYGVTILHEDQDVLVVNKPSGLAVHPTARDLHHTLTTWLRLTYPDNPPRPCHRLDRETSGVLICARTKSAESRIKQAFMHGEVSKTYVAVVIGHLEKSLCIDWPLALQGNRGLVRIKMIRDENGAPSRTDVEPLRYCVHTGCTLVRCMPKTGRQHQIRAHLAGEGFPIMGDKLYAMGEVYFDAMTKLPMNSSLPRLQLHAWRLEVFGLRVEAELPRWHSFDDSACHANCFAMI